MCAEAKVRERDFRTYIRDQTRKSGSGTREESSAEEDENGKEKKRWIRQSGERKKREREREGGRGLRNKLP